MNPAQLELLEELKIHGADERHIITQRIGQPRLNALLRWKLIQIIEIGSYELVTLGTRGRKALGMGCYHPDPDSLLERYIKRVVKAGLTLEGWTDIGPYSRNVERMADPDGEEVLVMVAFSRRITNIRKQFKVIREKRVLLFHSHPTRLASLVRYGTEIRQLVPPRPIPRRLL